MAWQLDAPGSAGSAGDPAAGTWEEPLREPQSEAEAAAELRRREQLQQQRAYEEAAAERLRVEEILKHMRAKRQTEVPAASTDNGDENCAIS